MSNLTIGKASDGPDTSCMKLAMMTVRLSNSLITAHPTNGVFDNNAPDSEGMIESNIFRRTRLTFGPFTRGIAVCGAFGDARISAVAQASHSVWQTRQQPQLVQQVHISRGTRHTRGHIHHLPSVVIYANLALEGVHFLFAAVVALLRRWVSRALDCLLETVNDYCQFWHVTQLLLLLPVAALSVLRVPWLCPFTTTLLPFRTFLKCTPIVDKTGSRIIRPPIIAIGYPTPAGVAPNW